MMTAREEVLEEEVKFLREEVRLLRIANDNRYDDGRRIFMPEPTPGHVDAAKVVVYENEAGEWFWSARDTNGEEVADSGDDGYVERSTALNAAHDLFPDAEIVEMDGSA